MRNTTALPTKTTPYPHAHPGGPSAAQPFTHLALLADRGRGKVLERAPSLGGGIRRSIFRPSSRRGDRRLRLTWWSRGWLWWRGRNPTGDGIVV